MRKSSVALLAAVLGLAGCATYDKDDGHGRRGDYRYAGSDYDRLGNDCGTFRGSGGALLDPWLACPAKARLWSAPGSTAATTEASAGRRPTGRISGSAAMPTPTGTCG